MADKRGKHPPPFSLRLTFEERAAIERAAGAQPLGAHIRSRLFDDDIPQRRTPVNMESEGSLPDG